MNQIVKFQKENCLQADGILGPNSLKKMQEVLHIKSKEHMAHFIGQCAHESVGFTRGFENLNYSEAGLLATFGKYFTTDTSREPHKKLASLYARKPEQIANWAYANRMGNGNEASGEGYFYRGVGPLQTSGKNNITAFANFVGNPEIIRNPGLIVTNYYFSSALFFFNENKLWRFCDSVNDSSILTLSRAINIGDSNSTGIPNHLEDREDKTKMYYSYLNR